MRPKVKICKALHCKYLQEIKGRGRTLHFCDAMYAPIIFSFLIECPKKLQP